MRTSFGFPAYFDGDNISPSPGIRFEWEGTPHQSRSVCYMTRVGRWESSQSLAAVPAFSAPAAATRESPRGREASAFQYALNSSLAPLKIGTYGSTITQSADISDLGMNDASVEPSVTYSAGISVSIGKLPPAGYTPGSVFGSGVLQPYIVWRDALGDTLQTDYGPEVTKQLAVSDPLGGYTSFSTVTMTATSPANAAWAGVGVRYEDSNGEVTPDTSILSDTAILVIGDEVPDYFDGETPNDAVFTYAWDGDPDRSSSIRVGEPPSSSPGPIVDPDCSPVPATPAPPSLPMGCEEGNVEEWRRVWYVIPTSEVYEWGSVVPRITLESGSDPVDVIRISLWSNPDDLAPQNFDDTSPLAGRWQISYLPANSMMILDGTTQTVTAQQPGGDFQPADYLVSGRGSGPIQWPTLECGDGYLLAVDTPLGDDPGNLTVTLGLTRRFG